MGRIPLRNQGGGEEFGLETKMLIAQHFVKIKVLLKVMLHHDILNSPARHFRKGHCAVEVKELTNLAMNMT